MGKCEFTSANSSIDFALFFGRKHHRIRIFFLNRNSARQQKSRSIDRLGHFYAERDGAEDTHMGKRENLAAFSRLGRRARQRLEGARPAIFGELAPSSGPSGHLLPGGEKNRPGRTVVTISGWPCGAGRDPFPWRAASGLRHRQEQPSDSRPAGPIFRGILPASCCDAS